MKLKTLVAGGFACIAVTTVNLAQADEISKPTYDDLLELFADWREFESPPLLDGAPDYTAEQFTARQPHYDALHKRLESFDIDAWPVPRQLDWHLVRAEMSGYDFNHRVLKPWARDPAFYNGSPRSRELVWILLAQRAARGLGSLHAHANEMTNAIDSIPISMARWELTGHRPDIVDQVASRLATDSSACTPVPSRRTCTAESLLIRRAVLHTCRRLRYSAE